MHQLVVPADSSTSCSIAMNCSSSSCSFIRRFMYAQYLSIFHLFQFLVPPIGFWSFGPYHFETILLGMVECSVRANRIIVEETLRV